MHKSFPHLLPSLIFAIMLFFIPNWNETYAYSTDAETQGVILYVSPGANGTCSSWADTCELQTALFNAVAGDQIWVAAGTYKPTTSTSRTATFQLKSGVAIYGGFPAAGGEWSQRDWETNTTTLSGEIGLASDISDNSYHVLTGSGVDQTAIVDGFSIAAGNANGNDQCDRGGGMYNGYYSSATLTNITFSDNIASFEGGGMYNESYSSPTLTNVTFSNNMAYHGGGMFNNSYSSATLINVSFIGNNALYGGGGMSNENSGNPILINATFSGNTASEHGGGIANGHSRPTMTNVTFYNNSAPSGGGMYTYSGASIIPVLSNAIFWGNVPDQISGPATVSYSDIQGGYTGIGNIDADPLLGDLSDNGGLTQTHALSAESPAIDYGDNEGCSGFDQRNYFRPTDGDGDGVSVCDMGAYEYDSYPKAFSLTVDITGNGSVNISPEKPTYSYGELVSLTAIPDPTWSFVGWSEHTRSIINPMTIAINGDTHIIGNFSQSVTLYVKPNSNGTCESWATACELQTALFNAYPGDQVWVAAGTYKPTTSSNRFATFQLKSGVAVFGGFPATGGTWDERDSSAYLTTLSGDIGLPFNNSDNSHHVVTGNGVDNTAILTGFSITGGNAEYYDYLPFNSNGGGMINLGGSPTLNDVTFADNSATEGGGMSNIGSRPTLTNVTFTGNSGMSGGGMANLGSSPTLNNATFTGNISTYAGGGMYNNLGSNPIITEATFSDNFADYAGAGMYNGMNSSPTLNNVTFNENIATSQYRSTRGGGVYNKNDSEPTLINVTFITNSASYGGGMYNDYSGSPTLTDVTFSSNSATNYGGGMYNTVSSPTLNMVSFLGNSAWMGGGMFNENISYPILTNVIFSGNTATYRGGGMFNYSSPKLTNVNFSGNIAQEGGGMSSQGINSTMTNVTFSGNRATNIGGGMAITDSNPTLINVTFSNNSVSGSEWTYGGGMWNRYSEPTLINVTFFNNSAEGDNALGGGIFNDTSSLTLTNTILWGNTPDLFNGWDSTVEITYSDIQGGYSGMGNIDIDPLLGDLADNGGFTQTHALGEGSPAIDVGDPTNCPVIDQREFARPIDGDGDGTATCDMGAYEYASYPATFSLALDIVGSGSVLKEPDKSEYSWGEVVTLTPVADPDWIFIGWGGDASGMDTPLTVTIYEDTNIIANFRFDAWTITLSVFPGGSGEVVKYPDQPTYHNGDQVTLTALPNPGWSFIGWTGDASGTGSQIVVTMNDNLEITANFAQIEYSLSVSVNPPGMGTVTKSPNKPYYVYGDVVTLTANSAVTGWRFIGWSGDASGVENPLQVTITGNTNITANFSNQYTLSTIVEPPGSGTITRDINQETYSYGTQVALTATPNPGWTFANWSGDVSGTDNPLSVTITGNTSITATFTQDEYTLTVTPSGSGTVSVDPVRDTYQYGDIVTLTPTSDQGWTFLEWGGNASGFDNPLSYTIIGNTSITAAFTQDEYTLTVTPIGSGTVAVDPVQATYHFGDEVTLTPTANPGWTFAGWGGDASGSDNPLTCTIISNTSITATFTQDEYTLAVTIEGSGSVAIEPVQATYHYGDVVTLTPAADPGWTFLEWGDDADGSDDPLIYTIIGDTSITAIFAQNEYTLLVDSAPVESGTVIISPLQTTYHYGDEVTLTPVANPGWTFSEWSGDASGSDIPLTLTILGNTNIMANFTQDQYTLDVTIEGFGSVMIEPSQATYIYGTEVTLTATADLSWNFVGWGGDASGSNNPLIFTIQENTSITALFTTNWIYLPMITR